MSPSTFTAIASSGVPSAASTSLVGRLPAHRHRIRAGNADGSCSSVPGIGKLNGRVSRQQTASSTDAALRIEFDAGGSTNSSHPSEFFTDRHYWPAPGAVDRCAPSAGSPRDHSRVACCPRYLRRPESGIFHLRTAVLPRSAPGSSAVKSDGRSKPWVLPARQSSPISAAPSIGKGKTGSIANGLWRLIQVLPCAALILR